MDEKLRQTELFSDVTPPEGTRPINDRCLLRTQDGHRVVVASGAVLAQYALNDRMAESIAMVNLVDQGWAAQSDVARAFDCSSRTIRRHQHRYEDGGLAALGRKSGYPQGRRRLRPQRTRLIQRLKAEGHSNRETARQIGVSEKAVRKLLRRMGWKDVPAAKQLLLPIDGLPLPADPNLSAFSHAAPGEPVVSQAQGADPNLSAFSVQREEDALPVTFDKDPLNRSMDRFFACVGMLDDAAPLFASGQTVPHAGVLLAIPPLVESGVFDCAQEIYGSLGPAFYGLRTTVLALLLMGLLRIKRPEGLKEQPPENLGRVLGLDRAPEVKTIRRKLARLAAMKRSVEFGRAVSQRRVALRGEALGFLYVDGHVRVYHGHHKLPKTHVARMRISLPATSDYWVNDAVGDPLFLVTAEANAGLAKMLPEILGEVRSLIGERRTTVVFDRGGYSPKLFARLLAQGFDLLTYRKGRFPRVSTKRFQEHKATIDKKEVSYLLADQGITLLGGTLRLRQVTRLSENGHQTPILTSRRDLPAVEVAFRMFERWRQENFFKYLREEYALDALLDYAVVPDDPNRDVPNPARAELEVKLREAQAELARLQAEYGLEALVNIEDDRPTMRGFKIAERTLGKSVWDAFQRVTRLQAKRARMPKRVPVHTVVEGEIVKLAPERKHLTSVLKMVSYQAESDLVRRITPHYKRAEDEGRTLVQSALTSAADLEVTDGELRVTLQRLSSAHRTRAVERLCEELNRSPTRFPGSHLRLRFAVKPPA